MRKMILAGVSAIVMAGAGVAAARAGTGPAADPGAVAPVHQTAANANQAAGEVALDPDTLALVLAQNDAPPPPGAGPGAPPPPPPPRPGMPGPGMAGPGRWGPGPEWHHDWHREPLFGLFFHREDKQLTPADVQKIAEAFLLWQGNRDWKVTQVAALPDGRIAFDFATADGGVIAKFTMDSRTGRIQRIG